MKKLTVKKGATCMACLECVEACSNAYYKESNVFKSCIQIVERKGEPKPMACPQCGKCAEVCEAGAITQNAKGVYMVNKKLCTGCRKVCGSLSVRPDGKSRGQTNCIQMYSLRYLCKSLSNGNP